MFVILEHNYILQSTGSLLSVTCIDQFKEIFFFFLLFQACERLLTHRLEMKMNTKKVDSILNRVHVAMPAPRDDKPRPPCIPG